MYLLLLISIILQKLAISTSTISTGTDSPVFTVPLEPELSFVVLSFVEDAASFVEG